jgi:hypothetical protein
MNPEEVRNRLHADGIDLSTGELELVALMFEGLLGTVSELAKADTGRFPFEPIDPSKAPDR